ncbi:hypothetical protein PV08_03885 [Exophiala spinifera]|uniref:Elongator complex protein 5 n=1 Tax=Exophiala spinifera TaxID=91928 RepID=A0A0D1ZVE5_9EURO|nr:uncharacterized protein PV08_03885 [Exophiala spinifera]KIW16697.1 hypothetical protein PV08_03885 [Exophiala spinifera]
MTHSNLSHRRTHNLLLLSKLLNQRDHASPLTLVLDTLEQPASPLVREYLRRSRLSKTTATVFLSFETFVRPRDVDHFVECYGEGGKSPQHMARQVAAILSRNHGGARRYLIIIDSLTRLSSTSTDPASNLNLTGFLSSLLQPPIEQAQQIQISLVAVYHTDVPLPSSGSSSHSKSSYSPSPLSLLSYLATTIITVHSLAILLAEKAARARSLAARTFGLREESEGVLIGLKPQGNLNPDERGVVLELEHRRKSGRGVLEWYFLPVPAVSKTQQTTNNNTVPQAFREIVTLLDDHPLFRKSKDEKDTVDSELAGMTFELGLTERQRLEREGVVLPYFDAQKAGGGGAGEGGRILYDMGVEDDFDEEEDEI